MIHDFSGNTPKTGLASFIAWNADISGNVKMGKGSSVWFGSTVRGDLSPITIGERTNIQDNCVLHVDSANPLTIGDDVTVGHGAIVHGCTVGSRCMIGMGAIILSRAVIGDECVIGAGSLIPEGKIIPPRSVVMGLPGKVVRSVGEDEIPGILEISAHYVERSEKTRQERDQPS